MNHRNNRCWPKGTQFRLRLNGEERVETLDAPKGSQNRISSESPLGQALILEDLLQARRKEILKVAWALPEKGHIQRLVKASILRR